MKKTALIIGIDSAIARELEKSLLNSGWTVWGTTRRKENKSERLLHFDLADFDTFDFSFPVDVLFLCASVTSMLSCRQFPDYAQKVNLEAQIHLAEHYSQMATHIVFLSTSAVFSGLKPAYQVDDLTCPTTLYGFYKAEVEKRLLSMASHVSIIRLTKVLSLHYPLITGWIQLLTQGLEIEPFNDLRLCPISIEIVVKLLKEIVERRIFGIIHISGEKDITYQQVAERLVEMMGLDCRLIKPKSAFFSSVIKEEAPLYTSLDMTQSKKLFAIPDTSLVATLNSLYGDILCNAPFAHP